MGGVWLVIEGFRAGPLWGLGLIFLSPVVTFIFLFVKPEYALKPWAVSFLGLIFLIVGMLMIPDSIVDIFNQFNVPGGF